MKPFGICLLFMVVATGILFLASSSYSSSDMDFHTRTMMAIHDKKLEESYSASLKNRRNTGSLDIEDYHHVDPAPSSKATIRHKPIQYGNPRYPYIPRKPPPGPPKGAEPPGGSY